ncbi:MAG: type II CRISPR RNA-guided endonuclease Cas9 [Bacteroidales bacterium]|nr:type II CRISPR RNA-guided endonuclease Cas9 [Bacteroidales bacterium]MDE7073402.1 type II CRISPR RNA-guided endonuclease Cas9 [Bacteroidales bacterium]
MKKILGLDLGTNSIGWAVVNEADNASEESSIVKLGVRVNPLTVDELTNFEKGKSITTNADRTLKRSMRRNLQRYKLRREALIQTLKEHDFITDQTLLSENGNKTTFETYRLRAKAAVEAISLEEFAKVLLMINKKRGYKSSRKVKDGEDGSLIDGMDLAKRLYDEEITPAQLCLQIYESGKNYTPDFYRSDLQEELDRIWNFQKQFYPDMLTTSAKEEIRGKNKTQTWAILAKYFVWSEIEQGDIKQTLQGIKRKTKGFEQKKENIQWRVNALSRKIHPEELAIVVQEINGQISSASGYLGSISDRSKILYFSKRTVGQYLMDCLTENPHGSLHNKAFYRQDYLNEFETIWEKQAEFHKELTPELKKEIRDTIVFYQRRLKSQKGLVSVCELENREVEIIKDGKTRKKVIGCKVIPRSSPLFQSFKIWQTLNDVEISVVGVRKKRTSKEATDNTTEQDRLSTDGCRLLDQDEKELLAKELFIREDLSKSKILSLLFENSQGLDLNFKKIDGNKTGAALYKAYSEMIELSGHEPLDFKKSADTIINQAHQIFETLGWNTAVLQFDDTVALASKEALEQSSYFRLWHLLYSFEGDNTPTGNGNLIQKIMDLCHVEKEYAVVLANVVFQDDYGSLSAKAIRKILPYLKEGNYYSLACEYAGYRHSKSSLNKDEITNKDLKDRLEILPKNSLRNPVVEKILNQMVNVVNAVTETYGRPDEIRVELARELKKNAAEREKMSQDIASNTKAHESIKKILQTEFGLTQVSRNDIIRYKLYDELKENGYKTLYTEQYISREKLFSKEIDIEHIIPKARLFDDSFSNKTLEYRAANIEKGNKTAYDYVEEKYGAEGVERYKRRCEDVMKGKPAKLKKLLMKESQIPDNFIERDLRNTQYIAKKALAMLGEISRSVVATSGSITDALRKDWELIDVMKELNWEKYKALDLVEYYMDKDGRQIGHIKDWTKRNDHRHHAMDALTVAFTKKAFIQYFNNKNASFDETTEAYRIKNKHFENGKAISPIQPSSNFRAQAKTALEDILVSIKAKNKVVTLNTNHIKKTKGEQKIVQQTPRGQLHLETVYGSCRRYETKEDKVNASFNAEKIATVSKKAYREALLKRLEENGNDPKKAFTGKNTLEKNPLWLDAQQQTKVPEKVKLVCFEIVYTIRKPIDESFDEKVIDKVIDVKIRKILKDRLALYGDAKKAFTNLEKNPIWLNEKKGIKLKRVTIRGISNAQSLHDKKDKNGNFILNSDGTKMPVDFVNTGNNHHVAIYRKPMLDKTGQWVLNEDGKQKYELEEMVVPFFEAVARVNQGLPVIDKTYKQNEGWQFLFSMKQNEYFVFPNETTGFNPKEIDLLDPKNYSVISPNLFRVQKFAYKNYVFRHHLETTIQNTSNDTKGVTWTDFRSSKGLDTIVKVRVNHIGQIVSVGEY